MIATTLDRLTVAYAASPVFADLSWEVHDDRIVGLVGPNGCGKSSILKTIVGALPPSAGTIAHRTGLSIGYLPQALTFPADPTLFDAVRQGAGSLLEVEAALAQLEQQLTDPRVYEDETALETALHAQEELIEQYDRLGGLALDARIRSMLHALGFRDMDLDRPVSEFSGGQRKLIGIAACVVDRPDVLLLDEPDNHLDLDGKRYLERFLRAFPGGVVLVSHDRYLLDLVVDEIVELEGGKLTRFPGNYSEYAVKKEHLRAAQAHQFADQQKEIRRLEQSAKRLMTWGAVYDNAKFIKRGQAIMKRLERMDRVERVHQQRRMDLRLKGWRGSTKVLEIKALAKSFPPTSPDGKEHLVLDQLDLLVRHGERIGLVGANGAGKSVLFRTILGEEQPTSGSVTLGPSIQVGYYAQEHETIDPGQSLIDHLRFSAGISEDSAMRTLLRFAFTYDQAKRPAGDLSGGERSRLQLALIVLSGANFLLLDEPTNNLDIRSAEILEETLETFEGAVLAISHDRYFLDRVADRIVELRDGALTDYVGGYSAFAAQTESPHARGASG